MDYVYEGGILEKLNKILSELPKEIIVCGKIDLDLGTNNDGQGEADPNL